MNLTIKTIDNKKYNIDIEENNTILDLKKILETKYKISINNQKLIYSGNILKDTDIISQLNITNFIVLFISKKNKNHESVIKSEPIVETEPEPEPEPIVETEPIVQPEPEPVIEPEPEPIVETEPKPIVEPEPEPEPEPIIETETEPEPVIEPEPEPIVETEPESESEIDNNECKEFVRRFIEILENEQSIMEILYTHDNLDTNVLPIIIYTISEKDEELAQYIMSNPSEFFIELMKQKEESEMIHVNNIQEELENNIEENTIEESDITNNISYLESNLETNVNKEYLEQLQNIFPDLQKYILIEALEVCNNNLDGAMNYITDYFL